MKTTYITAVGIILLVMSAIHAFAIENLAISVQCSNVVLSWPSIEGETYIVQYRPTLDPSTPWQTLTSSLPANIGTNITCFVHSNIVQNPNCSGGDSDSMMMSGGSSLGASSDGSPVEPDTLVVMRPDGSGAAPLMLYPPGVNLSGFVIFDPLTGQTVSGSGYETTNPSSAASQDDGPDPGGAQPDDSGSNSLAPDMAFYQVARIGIHIIGESNLTSEVVSNTITIPFEAANDVGILQDISVLVDGAPYQGMTPISAPDIVVNASIDTTLLQNGQHTFEFEGHWLNPDTGTDPNSLYLQQFSDVFTLTVSNDICFLDWESEVSELGFTPYNVTMIYTNVNWQIDIYDSGSNYVQTLSGYSDDGMIATNWNLTDWQGNLRTNADLDPSFSGILTVGDPQKKKLPPKHQPWPYPPQGQWIITFQDIFQQMLNSNAEYSAINSMGSIGAQFGGAVTYFPSSNPTNGQTFPLRFHMTNNPVSTNLVPGTELLADENALASLLTNRVNRNFFYFGHASGSSFATMDMGMLNLYITPQHYFRFVYMGGCESATGNLQNDFGINFNAPQALSYFQAHGIRPRAFMGNLAKVAYCELGVFTDPNTGATCFGEIPPEVTEYLENFEFYLDFNYTLSEALFNAVNDTPQDLGPFWDTGEQMTIYGFDDLQVNSYNYQTDWSN